MSWNNLLQSILVLLFAFGLKWALALIGIVLDEVQFNTIVAAAVAWLLAQFGVEVARGKVRGIK